MINIRKTLIIAFLLVASGLYAQKADERVGNLIETKDWFALDEEFPLLKDSISSQGLKGWAEVLLGLQFNILPEGVNIIDSLLINHQKESEAYLVDMIIAKSTLLYRMGYYAEAADILKDLIEQLQKFVPKDDLAPLLNNMNYFNKLRNVGRLGGNRPNEDVEVPMTIKKITRGFGMLVPVRIGNKEYEFLFDTGASQTLISERFCDEMGLRIIMDSCSVTGSHGNVTGKLATLDSLFVGSIKFQNPLILVLPVNKSMDSLYKIEGIIGTDFMKLMGELRIFPQKGKIIFPRSETPIPASGRNMVLEDNLYYLKTYSENKKLKIHFDTGNVESDLYGKEHINPKARKETMVMGWIGGVEKREILRLKMVPFRLGETDFQLKNIIVDSRAQANEDGAFGMSFIKNFSEIIINFRKMFVSVRE